MGKFFKWTFIIFGTVSFYFLLGHSIASSILIGLFVHEMGHAIAMKKLGYGVKEFYYIPFIGAAVESNKIITRKRHNLIVYFAGPVFGILFSLISLCLFKLSDYAFFNDVYRYGILLNVSNLIPAGPLDGGRIIKFLLMGKNFNKKTYLIYLASNILGLYLIYHFWGFGIFFFLMLYPTFNELSMVYKAIVYIENESERAKLEEKIINEKDEEVKKKLKETEWLANYHWTLIENN